MANVGASRMFRGRLLKLLHACMLFGVVGLLTGCGAIWDSAFPPVQKRDQMAFHAARNTPHGDWSIRMGPQGDPTVYVQQQPLFTGAAIEMVEPMIDAQGTYFVGVQLDPKATSRLAKATEDRDVRLIAMLWQGSLFAVLPVDEPITGGTFAIPVNNAASAETLSKALDDRSSQ